MHHHLKTAYTIQVLLHAFGANFPEYFLKCQLPVVGIGIVFIFFLMIGVSLNTLRNIHKLDPLLFRRRTPALEQALVKCAYNLIKWIDFLRAAIRTSRIRVLRVKLRFRAIQPNSMTNSRDSLLN